MSMNQTKLSGVTYDSNGQLQYNQLYPMLKDYWDKPLAEMPEDLRFRVKFAVPSWDDIDSSNVRHVGSSQVTVRQQLIKYYEWHQDPSQERDTYKALREFQDEKLRGMIDEAIRNGIASVAVALRDDVALSLEKIICEVGIHWPETEPLLWRSLYRFREKTLPIIRDQAKVDKDSHLVLALDEISSQIHIILRAQQYRMGDEIELELNANAAENPSHVFVKLEEMFKEKPTLKPLREDERNVGSMREKHIRIIRQRCDAILSWLKANNYDPQDLPPPLKNGMATVKATCRVELCKNTQMFSSLGLFEKAWQQLRADKEIIGLK
jgi:hypothetical protein